MSWRASFVGADSSPPLQAHRDMRVTFLQLIASCEAVDGAAVALGRPALPAFPRRGFGLGQGTAGNGAEVLIKAAGNVGRPAPFGERQDLEHAHRAIERDRYDIALSDSLARQPDPPPVDPHVS